MPRPVLRQSFNLTYRKIPVLVIGREVYCDTSLILEALEHVFSDGHPSLYPVTADGRNYRPVIRGFASYWTDRPFFRVATGLIPSSVWRTHFGTDRAELIGHKLDPNKLEAKVPRNLSNLDLHLSILEPQFQSGDTWLFNTKTPSLADIALFYQLDWACDIAAGRGIANLTGGGTRDTDTEGALPVFNPSRYPAMHRWFLDMRKFLAELSSMETRREIDSSDDEWLTQIKMYEAAADAPLVPTPVQAHKELDAKNGLLPGTKVSVAPDDTGRDDPTFGTLIALSPEEVVIKPQELESKALVDGPQQLMRLFVVVASFPTISEFLTRRAD
ncbi:hypothetical protein B0A49_00585 [Cryomyces minteri]|uniref:DUF7962 domain-containing protein n=1 Tax=Cryomyces minteri TaxID=331657 RepID=A0A4U0XYM7_9PEZI|nr:hypothetical protein B0A49_00585 [Cryomyces minteri]